MAEGSGKWRGLHGGGLNQLYVGAWVMDQATGQLGQIERLLDADWVELRFEDGRVARVRLTPAAPTQQ